MNAAIDIGNTRIKVGIFKEDVLLEKINLASDKIQALQQFLEQQKVRKVILGSSGNIPDGLEKYLNSHYFYIRLETNTNIPLENVYHTPHTLGKDRVAAAVGAKSVYPNQDCIVIDAGTCITYELVNRHGVYLGGNISPGIDMRLRAMDEFTAALPLVQKQHPNTNRGYSTETALRNGAVWGATLEIEGFIQAFSKNLDTPFVILTGGDAMLLASLLNTQATVLPNLVLIGLNKILNHNAAA